MASGPMLDDKAERDELDLVGACWRRAPGSDPAEPLVEYAFIAHSDGKTYVVLRNVAAPDGPYQVYTRAEWPAG
ncbi:MAG: DUF397 domain-containing protein [Pseudonocardiales bacterium]|nr:DUF397 domain-containing protein [Pseudonocardiales bacterium]